MPSVWRYSISHSSVMHSIFVVLHEIQNPVSKRDLSIYKYVVRIAFQFADRWNDPEEWMHVW